jgi:hypothetical protein
MGAGRDNADTPYIDDGVSVQMLPVSASLSAATPGITASTLAPGTTFLRLMGVNYVHLITENGGDLYVTEHGLPFLKQLSPENWYDSDWFASHKVPLQGTGTVYRIATRPVANKRPHSIDLVVKWSRVGQDVAFDTFTLKQAINADFNSPFEEFSLVNELRQSEFGRKNLRVLAQKPLAIYVPPDRMQLWQTGRLLYKIRSKLSRHTSVELDILRSYIMVYGWIKGTDAADARKRGLLPGDDQAAALEALTQRVQNELREKGFTVADHKPAHAILRVRPNGTIRSRHDQVAYALVDYELLARTNEHEDTVRKAGRSRYLILERDRFHPDSDVHIPSHLNPANVLGVDYVFGRAESTGGTLWVVGKDPRLFDYFQPERWRSKQIALSGTGRTWYVRTKDAVHLVWKVCRVGDIPVGDTTDPRWKSRCVLGYNSPFEKFALALEMARKGVPVVNPRAIYVTAHHRDAMQGVADVRRFEKFESVLTPDGLPVMPPGPDYVAVWGFWRGLDDARATDIDSHWSPIGAEQAHLKSLLSDEQLEEIVERHGEMLADAGYEDMSLEADHILLCYVPGGAFKVDGQKRIETRHCNFEMVRKIGNGST